MALTLKRQPGQRFWLLSEERRVGVRVDSVSGHNATLSIEALTVIRRVCSAERPVRVIIAPGHAASISFRSKKNGGAVLDIDAPESVLILREELERRC